MDEPVRAAYFECMYCGSRMREYAWGLMCSDAGCQSMRVYSVPWCELEEVIDARRYRTGTAVLLAYTEIDTYFNGFPLVAFVDPRDAKTREIFANGKRVGVFRTPKGRYFLQAESFNGSPQLYAEGDFRLIPSEHSIEALSQTRAIDLYSKQKQKVLSIEEAFPNIELEDA